VASDLIIALAGPTATGKTDVALELADRFDVALISLDSAMVYRQMDIGTAKPAADLLARYPHALVNIRDPADVYSVADFLREADAAVTEAFAAGRTPVLVGGTMLYLKTFREGLAAMPAADSAIRARLSEELERHGAAALHARLVDVDPLAAARMHPNNFSRVQRALEVFEISGQPISSFWSASPGAEQRLGARLQEFAVEPESRPALHARISTRLDAMLAMGLVDEVAGLKARGDLHLGLPSMRAVGYRQVWEHLDRPGQGREDELREKILSATRQLAKRQLTWLRSWTHMSRVEATDPAILAAEIARKSGLQH
jgi:tRNA dimethylallyltransferase